MLDQKFDDVHLLLERSNTDTLILGETLLNKSFGDHELNIPGYIVFRSDREKISLGKRGGGLIVFVKDIFDIVLQTSLCTSVLDIIWLALSFLHACKSRYVEYTYPLKHL